MQDETLVSLMLFLSSPTSQLTWPSLSHTSTLHQMILWMSALTLREYHISPKVVPGCHLPQLQRELLPTDFRYCDGLTTLSNGGQSGHGGHWAICSLYFHLPPAIMLCLTGHRIDWPNAKVLDSAQHYTIRGFIWSHGISIYSEEHSLSRERGPHPPVYHPLDNHMNGFCLSTPGSTISFLFCSVRL